MAGYIITCPADTDWAMSHETFTATLLARWPNAKTGRDTAINGIALIWHIEDQDIDLEGHLDEDGLTVGLDDSEGFALFTCWYRTVIPPEIPLILMDTGYNDVYLLTPDTKPDDIISGRGAIQPPPDPEILVTRTR